MQVAIHAGAAFTDEGLVLRSLQRNTGALHQNGASVFGPRRYRQIFEPAFAAIENQDEIGAAMEMLRAGLRSAPKVDRLIYSCASFAGDVGNALDDGQLYPNAGRRMELLEKSFPDHEIELCMGFLSPGRFIPKALMSLPEQSRLDKMRSTDISCLSWISMVEDIRDLAPNVKITLWSNEDAPLIWGDIVRAIAALPSDNTLVDEFDLLLSLLDDSGKSKGLALIDQSLEQDEHLRDDLATVLEEHAKTELTTEELDLPDWSMEIVDAFAELYAQDMDRLESMPGVQVLKP